MAMGPEYNYIAAYRQLNISQGAPCFKLNSNLYRVMRASSDVI